MGRVILWINTKLDCIKATIDRLALPYEITLFLTPGAPMRARELRNYSFWSRRYKVGCYYSPFSYRSEQSRAV